MDGKIRDLLSSIVNEFSIDYDGWKYLVIYGKHINGWFCAIPNWNISCELAEPMDVLYNTDKLNRALDDTQKANVIALAIKKHYLRVKESK